MKEKKKEEINMKLFGKLLHKLIKDDKIKFSFYNNSLLKLELLQICYDKPNNTIEFEFRDIMGEHINELRNITKDSKICINYRSKHMPHKNI